MLLPLNNLALAWYESGHMSEARQILEQAIAIGEKSQRTDHMHYGALLINYAEFLRKTGRKSEAKQFEVRGKDVIAGARRRNGVGQTIDIASFRSR